MPKKKKPPVSNLCDDSEQEEDDDGEKSSHGRYSRVGPKLSYRQALNSYVFVGAGIRMIRNCAADEISALVEACLPTTNYPDRVKKLLAGLDFSQKLDRWYALDLLRECGAQLPLFASLDEALEYGAGRAG